MNIFYRQPAGIQWIEAILLAILGFYPALLISEVGFDEPILYGFFLLYIPLGQFCVTPLLTLAGIYRYYSPMLLGYIPSTARIELHSGSSFDYLLTMLGTKPGNVLRNKLLGFYLEGLLALVNQVERGELPDSVQIEGNSYFFNTRTAQKMGFTLSSPSWFHRLNIVANFIDITWMYSLAKGRFAVPDLLNPKKVTITGRQLVAHKTALVTLYTALRIQVN